MVASGELLDSQVQQLLRGDETAFRLVYRDLQPRLLRYVTVLVGPSHADDVTAEAWLQAFRDLDRFVGGADEFRAWLTTIARHRAMDHLRAEQRRVPAHAGLDEAAELAAPDDVEGTVLAAAGTREMLGLVSRLPVDQREAIMLRSVLGFDGPTAARILGKRAGAVRAATLRGVRSLGRTLEERDRTAAEKSREKVSGHP